jgi:hypothetical protein
VWLYAATQTGVILPNFDEFYQLHQDGSVSDEFIDKVLKFIAWQDKVYTAKSNIIVGVSANRLWFGVAINPKLDILISVPKRGSIIISYENWKKWADIDWVLVSPLEIAQFASSS